MTPEERVQMLLTSAAALNVGRAYDEVLEQVSARADTFGSLGKLDLGALTAWKRLRADTPWMAKLMALPDDDVRAHTGRAVTAARDESKSVPEAASAARSALYPLPGFGHGPALASAVCFAAAPHRLAVYDSRAHRGLSRVGLELAYGHGCYGPYMALLTQCCSELATEGHNWTARQVDLALFQLGHR